MGYSITFWSFLVALVVALCCRLAESARPTNPESDPNCIPVESVLQDDSTWNKVDRVFICQLYDDQFDVYSYEKNEPIGYLLSYRVVFKELWALSIHFQEVSSWSTSYYRFTFSQIEHAQKFYAKVKPKSRFSPQYFTIRGFDKITGQSRRTVTENSLVFHQHLIDANTTIFTFDAAEGSGAAGPFLTFIFERFQMARFRSDTDVILASRGNDVYNVLKFGDAATSGKFMNYMNSYVDSETEYTFPAE